MRFIRDLCFGVGRRERPGFFYITPQVSALHVNWDAVVEGGRACPRSSGSRHVSAGSAYAQAFQGRTPLAHARIAYRNPWLLSAENQTFMSLAIAGHRRGIKVVHCASHQELLACRPEFVLSVSSSVAKIVDIPSYLTVNPRPCAAATGHLQRIAGAGAVSGPTLMASELARRRESAKARNPQTSPQSAKIRLAQLPLFARQIPFKSNR
jgi:hypothetical protein